MTQLVSDDAIAFWSTQVAAWSAMAADENSFYTKRSHIAADLLTRHLASGSVLDIGCGPGFLAGELLRRRYDAYGADVSQAMVEAARTATGEPGRFSHTADGRIPFEGPFDGITAIGVFPYVRDYACLAADIREHLRAGGIAVASCTNARSLYTAFEIWRRLLPGRISRAVVMNLLRTGVWSAGFVDARDRRQAYAPSEFDRVLRAARLERIDSVSLYNWRSLDANPLQRGPALRSLARLLGWTYIGVYRAS